MLEKIFDSMIKSLENGNVLLLFVIIIFALLINAKTILEFLEQIEAHHNEFLKDALSNDTLSSSTRVYIQEKLNMAIFKKATGIYAEKTLREKILEICEM